MENLNQLFSNLGTEQSILILSWLIITFLLGLLAGYFLRNRYVSELNRQLEEKEQQLTAKQLELDQIQHELALKEADLKRAAFEAEEAQLKIRRGAEEVARLNQLLASAQVELDKMKAEEQASASIINDLNDQILGLKTKNAQLVEGGASPIEVPVGGSGEALDRLAAIEIQLARLTEENSALLRKLGESGEVNLVEQLPMPQASRQNEPNSGIMEPAGEFFVPKLIPAEPEPVQETPNLGNGPSTLFNADKVLLRTGDKDDLTAIEGIGPFLEKKLNDAGVFTYAEIAKWDAAKIAEITAKISFFEGRIEKDDWVGQAQKLIDETPEEFAESSTIAEARGLEIEETHVVPALDDLKRILGIDEAIEKILFTAGINSFAELAKMDPDEIRNILVVVDPALNGVDPSAWPAQARLALDEEWEVLQDYQEQLKGA
ncbi:MAG: helix-hairpin-helix domain-containing protein [Haliscomenobacter sp.]|uniref:helix-hairpin-helix domain-containing protein n=1 Tax=Haliscomenobacter sp. TaxID=2717303 RepID=UPI0029A764E6|nr:helix-hairpin-helix domain-containing protein [Haliscomenobacter sp.]MDX2067112.1 helix-hairpin-helix domain-containing protein [Haliscomenobacter sp.]